MIDEGTMIAGIAQRTHFAAVAADEARWSAARGCCASRSAVQHVGGCARRWKCRPRHRPDLPRASTCRLKIARIPDRWQPAVSAEVSVVSAIAAIAGRSV